jgi:4-alpha-glucanotransferase
VPAVPIKLSELQELYHDEGRIKWITTPHIPTHEVWEAVQREGHGSCEDVERVFGMALERVGSEELWLFKNFIKHDKDIEALDIHPAGRVYLMRQWSNRIFQAYDKDSYSPLWNYRNSRAYATFSGEEREILEDFLYRKQQSSEKTWETNGKKLLSVLQESSPMLACAEDLGVLNECVPRVLNKLKILSLKVIRWERAYNEEGQPYRSFSDYPELSVCTTSVHDSSTLREWWETEADQNAFAAFSGYPSLPKIYNPGTARKFLFHAASALSRFRIFPLIDFLHLTSRWYADNPASERINVPGTSNEFNWTWRLPATVAEIAKDTELIKAVKELSLVEAAKKTKKTDSEKKS